MIIIENMCIVYCDMHMKTVARISLFFFTLALAYLS